MSDATMEFWTIVNMVFVGIIGLATIALLIWMARDLFWHLHDKRMQKSRRIRNSELDSAYRTGMFNVGRDVKGKY
jgi:hypothetical protein